MSLSTALESYVSTAHQASMAPLAKLESTTTKYSVCESELTEEKIYSTFYFVVFTTCKGIINLHGDF